MNPYVLKYCPISQKKPVWLIIRNKKWKYAPHWLAPRLATTLRTRLRWIRPPRVHLLSNIKMPSFQGLFSYITPIGLKKLACRHVLYGKGSRVFLVMVLLTHLWWNSTHITYHPSPIRHVTHRLSHRKQCLWVKTLKSATRLALSSRND